METKKVQLIEQTEKKWKVMQLIGAAFTLFSACVFFMALMAYSEGRIPKGILFDDGLSGPALGMATGLFVFTSGRVLAWWHHG